MICGYCQHWQLSNTDQIADGVPLADQQGRCRKYSRAEIRLSSCESFAREPGSDDDQQYARYMDRNA